MKPLFFTYKYQSLKSDGLVFSRLMDEFGNAESREDNREDRIAGLAKDGTEPLQYKPDSAEDALMQLEERNVGAVSWDVYKKYLRFAGGLVWAPVVLVLLILTQANQGREEFLCYSNVHAERPFQLSRRCFSAYGREILYPASVKAVTWVYTLRLVGTSLSWYLPTNALLTTLSTAGAATAITSFALTYAFVYVQLKIQSRDGLNIDSLFSSSIGLFASLNLFKTALSGVLRSPVSFFDTTPMGIKLHCYLSMTSWSTFPQAECYRGCRKIRTLSIKICRWTWCRSEIVLSIYVSILILRILCSSYQRLALWLAPSH